MVKNNKLNIFLINCDWTDMFSNNFVEFKEKLVRDRLAPDVNSFFVFSWANLSYKKDNGNYRTVQLKTRFSKFRPILDVISLFKVYSIAKENNTNPDIWITYDFGFLPALWIAKKLIGGEIVMVLNNQPRIYSMTRDFGRIKAIYSWLVEILFHNIPDHYFTINETMNSYIGNLGIKRDKITVFSMNTIDRDLQYISKAQKGIIRDKYNIKKGSKIIITVARLEAEKNYFKLLELFSTLSDEFVLIALGRGSLLKSLQDECQRLKISDRVIFAGFVQRDEIWNYYADADIFVLLSKAEALGIVFWEAMYMNIPVIGSNADGIVETIGKDKERGRLWNENSGNGGAESFRECVNFCLSNSNELKNMIDSARRYVDDKRTNKVVVNDILTNK